MADNIDITPGTGKTVATDDCGAGGHAQVVKLAISTDGSVTFIPADTANGLDVDVTRLPALAAGTNAIGKLAANSGVDIGDVDVTSLPALAAGSNLIGKANLAPATSGGLSIYRSLSVDSTGVNIKSSAGQVYGYYIANTAAAWRYVKLYNTSGAPTVGTTTPVITIPVPPLGAANVSYEQGIAFGTGIGIGCVTAVADASTANTTANDVIANVYYA